MLNEKACKLVSRSRSCCAARSWCTLEFSTCDVNEVITITSYLVITLILLGISGILELFKFNRPFCTCIVMFMNHKSCLGCLQWCSLSASSLYSPYYSKLQVFRWRYFVARFHRTFLWFYVFEYIKIPSSINVFCRLMTDEWWRHIDYCQ